MVMIIIKGGIIYVNGSNAGKSYTSKFGDVLIREKDGKTVVITIAPESEPIIHDIDVVKKYKVSAVDLSLEEIQ